jgi:hypothetical protein
MSRLRTMMNDALYSRFEWTIIGFRGHHVELTKNSLTIAPSLTRSFLSCLISIYLYLRQPLSGMLW